LQLEVRQRGEAAVFRGGFLLSVDHIILIEQESSSHKIRSAIYLKKPSSHCIVRLIVYKSCIRIALDDGYNNCSTLSSYLP
jgi:hypothetical protein